MGIPVPAGSRHRHVYEIECFDAGGRLKWRDRVENLITNAGLDDILGKYWKGSGYTAAFYVGLTDDSPSVAGADTMSSHAGWAEATGYSESVRQTLTLGSVSSQSVDNSASKATFSISTGDDIGGAFITTDDTKGGTSGILVAVGAFSGGDRTVADGDTLTVTITLTTADDGA